MSVKILVGDVRARLAELPADHFDCVVTSPPYWGLRDYGVEGQIGLERTLGEHLDVMVDVFRAVRRVMKPTGSLWLNYGDCYATTPNGRSAADTKAAGQDDRTFRDKPFSTIGPIRSGRSENLGNLAGDGVRRNRAGAVYDPDFASSPRGNFACADRQVRNEHSGRIVAGAVLKAKDLCMIPNRVAIALQEDGWWVRSEIVWGKPNAMPDSSGRYRPATAHEKIWLLSKTGKMFYDAAAVRMPAASGPDDWKQPDGWDTGEGAHGSFHRAGREKGAPAPRSDKQRGHSRRHAGFNDRWDAMEKAEQQANGRLLRNYEPDPFQIFHLATASFSEAHFATYPPDLAEICLRAGCPNGGLVLDPFGGAGTTALVADRLGLDCTLIELNPAYAELARKRIAGDAPMLVDCEVAA